MSITITERVAEVVEAACGHVHDADDVTTCADGIPDTPAVFGAGRCYRGHAEGCEACTERDINDYEWGF